MTASQVSLDDILKWAPDGRCQSLHMLRLDKIHPVVSGNKWFKLQPWLKAAREAGLGHVLSFGGGYSNHLVALAFAARQAGLQSTGIVRGHYPAKTPTLITCEDLGMELRFVSAAEYAGMNRDAHFEMREAFIIPEGGAGEPGIDGAAGIAALIPAGTGVVCVAAGTGTTMAGLDRGLPEQVDLHVFGAARDMQQAEALIRSARHPQRIFLHQVADPRFGRWTPGLLHFMTGFLGSTGIPLDVVYTAKMMQRFEALLEAGVCRGKRVVCIHTGGLQGNPAGRYPG